MNEECEKCGKHVESITIHPDGTKLCFDCACKKG